MQRGSHKHSHNHVLEVGLARACDQQQMQVSSEVRVKFEQAGMRVRTAAGLSDATESAKERACARATQDLWPVGMVWAGAPGRTKLR